MCGRPCHGLDRRRPADILRPSHSRCFYAAVKNLKGPHGHCCDLPSAGCQILPLPAKVQILQPYMELLQELCVVARGFRAIAVLHGRAELAARLRPAQRSPLPPVCSRLSVCSVERLLAGDIPAIVRPLRRSVAICVAPLHDTAHSGPGTSWTTFSCWVACA